MSHHWLDSRRSPEDCHGGNADLVLVHSSDLHLTSELPFGQHGPRDELAALRRVIRAAEEAGADVLLLAGDVFDSNRQSASILDAAARLMADAAFPIVILPGNHDPLTTDSVYQHSSLTGASSVVVLGLSVEEAVLFPELDLQVWGRAHVDYSDMRPLRDRRPRASRWQVAMAHGHYVDGSPGPHELRGSWLIYSEDITATGADYVALGHWNRAARVGDGGVPAYYSGSPDFADTINVVRFSTSAGVQVILTVLKPDSM